MQHFTFWCPYCHAHLKAQDRTMVGRKVPCPDCNRPFQVAYDARHSRLVGLPFEVPDSSETAGSTPTPESPSAKESPTAARTGASVSAHDVAPPEDFEPPWWKQPYVFAWAVAGIFGIGAFIALWSNRPPDEPPTSPHEDAGQIADIDIPERPPARDLVEQPEDPDTHPQLSWWESPGKDAEAQLQRLFGQVHQQRLERGHFPPGTRGGAAEDRFSWLADLLAQSEGGIEQPNWDRSWHDPENQPFSKRRIPAFLNPAIAEIDAENGFPATHFVGVAGVGADAAELAISDRRAGVFGANRKTTPDDIKDGTAHTMLVVGLQNRLSAWADGASSYRGLVNEPYINGPDGFGTGQQAGMWVLMADGSVLFRGRDTAAEILRSEAAMSDQFYAKHPPPVFAQIEEPDQPDPQPQAADPGADDAQPPVDVKDPIGELTEIVEGLVQSAEKQTSKKSPPKQKLALTRKQIEARLNQPLARYALAPGAKFGPVFLELEELISVPLEYDQQQFHAEGKLWNRAVKFEGEDVTVGEVFKQLLSSVNLATKIKEGKIVITAKTPGKS